MWCFWSAKGGVGCTVVACAVALGIAERRPALLVDLAGDLSAVLGRPGPQPGLAEWLAAPNPPPDALSRLEVEVAPGLSLLAWGRPDVLRNESGQPPPPADPAGGRRPVDRAELLAAMIDVESRLVIVDIGMRSADGRPVSMVAGHLLSLADRSTVVTRGCSLAVRAAERWPPPDDIIVVAGRGRATRAGAIAAALGAPVVARLRWDPAIARAVDAGRLATRRPRSLRRLSALAVEAS